MKQKYIFQLLTDDKKVIEWDGENWEEAAQRAANCLRVTIIAWRHPPVEIVIGIPEIKE